LGAVIFMSSHDMYRHYEQEQETAVHIQAIGHGERVVMKYTEEHTRKIDRLRRYIRKEKKEIASWLWFDEVLRDHFNGKIAENTRYLEQIPPTGRDKKHLAEEIAQYREVLKVEDLGATVALDCQYILDQISNARITPHQVEVLDALYFTGISPLPMWLDYLKKGVPSSLQHRMAPLKVWTEIKALQRIPREPEPSVPRTWSLANTHPDKTDSEGKPYYMPFDNKTGLPVKGYDESLLSQTNAAVSARTRKYAGPTKTPEQYAKDAERAERGRKKRVAEYLKKKDEQRKKAREDHRKRYDKGLKKFEDDLKRDKRADEKRKEELEKMSSGGPPRGPVHETTGDDIAQAQRERRNK
jgi:hypothetical protein